MEVSREQNILSSLPHAFDKINYVNPKRRKKKWQVKTTNMRKVSITLVCRLCHFYSITIIIIGIVYINISTE